MDELPDAWRRVADTFSATVEAVPPDGWERPSPCDGWVARDVVRHLVDWVPSVLATGADLELIPGPDVDEDPVGAWGSLDAQLRAVLDDPDRAALPFDHPQAGRSTLSEAIGALVLGDVLVHTWDVARATGQEVRLDPEVVHAQLEGMAPMVDALVASGHYGPPVRVPDDADEQARLVALTGRRP